MAIILYTIVVLLATMIGATSGAGGGAIIKPVFDLIGRDTVTVIGMYSTIAVFSMCLSSIYEYMKSGVAFEKKILFGLSLGSLAGGLLGDQLLKRVAETIPNHTITMVQSILLFIVLLSVFLFTRMSERFPKLGVRNPFAIVVVGMLVGMLSVFLGIGGGPLNIIVLVGLMSFSPKESSPYSIAMIFFAQIPKMVKLLVVAQPATFQWPLVPLIVVAAVIGGKLGTKINRRMNNKQVNLVYSLLMFSLLVVCFYNIISNIH